jgi:hypothetical protein
MENWLEEFSLPDPVVMGKNARTYVTVVSNLQENKTWTARIT